jgi:hypothetical protein
VSASAPTSCPTCGEAVQPGARFCATCGSPLDIDRGTAVIPMPPSETGPVPVAVVTSEPRLFGVLPPWPLLIATVVVLAFAIVLFATGHWALGLVLLGLALLGLAGFLEAARRTPDALVARRSGAAIYRLRAWTGFARETVSARSRVSREVALRRRELWELGQRRHRLLFELGEAAYRGDGAAADALRRAVEELDAAAERKQWEIGTVVGVAEARVRQAHLEVQPTEMVQIPEPYPPPDEGTPPMPAPVPEPSPAPVPEPYPPPDEASPPAPPAIPEPMPPGPEQ